jgi:hypothetical protein
VTFIIAAIVVPEGDCSIAMTRDCFELGVAFLVFGMSAVGRAGFAVGTDAADDAAGCRFADFDIEILRSVQGGVVPHHRSPITAMKPAGQDLWARKRPKLATVPLCWRSKASPFWIIFLLSCVSSEGWCVQQESNLPGQESGAP